MSTVKYSKLLIEFKNKFASTVESENYKPVSITCVSVHSEFHSFVFFPLSFETCLRTSTWYSRNEENKTGCLVYRLFENGNRIKL